MFAPNGLEDEFPFACFYCNYDHCSLHYYHDHDDDDHHHHHHHHYFRIVIVLSSIMSIFRPRVGSLVLGKAVGY